MPMYEAIKNFNAQFSYKPTIENIGKLPKLKKFIAVGMGGSHLAAGLLKIWNPGLNLIIHKNYGLPLLDKAEIKSRLIILSSYSGNTEETLSAYDEAAKKNLTRIAISTGGELLRRAKQDKIPYIKLPAVGIQPRSALGFNFKALLKILGEENALKKTEQLQNDLQPSKLENKGKILAGRLNNYIPIIYSSPANEPLAYAWKTKFNETGKIPAFYNVFPELNHNEMAGFGAKDNIRRFSTNFFFIFLKDSKDYFKIQKRMSLMENFLLDRKLPMKICELKGKTIFHKIFSSLILADWAAYYTAQNYHLDPEQIPAIEKFKKMIK